MKIAGFEVWNYQEGEPVNVVAMSGGKDSTATELLAIERNTPNLMCVHADTGHEHPVTRAYIEYLRDNLPVPIHVVTADLSDRMNRKADKIEHGTLWSEESEERRTAHVKLLRERTGNPFLDMAILHSAFPSRVSQFCTEDLKLIPATNDAYIPIMREGHELIVWTGVRRDESKRRANLESYEPADAGYMQYRPILDWDADRVFAFHDLCGIKPNPLYKLGMKRVGCMPCMQCGKVELREVGTRFPEEVQRVREWESVMNNGGGREYSKKGNKVYHGLMYHKMVTAHLQDAAESGGIDSILDWAIHGPDQQKDLFPEDPPSCSSLYGLCE